MSLAIGITAIGYSLCTAFSMTKKLEAITPLVDNTGRHVETDYRNPMFDISLSGEGDLPADLVAGSDGGGDFAPDGVTGGKTIILETDEGDNNDKYNTWSAKAENWPGA